jgi:hypothetical protein
MAISCPRLVCFLWLAAMPNLALGDTGTIESSKEITGPLPEAMASLKQMRSYLVNKADLEFESDFTVTSDLPGLSDRGTAHFFIRQPDRFRVELVSRSGRQVFVSDGQTLTLYRPDEGKFAQLKARDSIVSTMYLVAGLLNIQARFIDFLWTVDYGQDVRIAAGRTESIGNKQCRRISLARFEDDWEVWLQQVEVPLPCKLLSRRTDGSAHTSHTNVFRWKTSPIFPPEVFAFSAPKGSRKVEVSELD